MKLLIAEDDPFFCRLLQQVLALDHELAVTRDGDEAWAALEQGQGPRLAVLDWVMPGLTGPEICRRVRHSPGLSSMYLILLTARNSSADVIAGLRAGADDYVTKPFSPEELRIRVQVGERVVSMQARLAAKVAELEQAWSQAKELKSLLPICPCCKRIRVDERYWRYVTSYLRRHPDSAAGHSACPCCADHTVTPGFQLPPWLPKSAL